MLVFNATKKAELDALNSSGCTTKQLHPIELTDGRFALNSDLLDDCQPTIQAVFNEDEELVTPFQKGGTWEHYRDFLLTLQEEDVSELMPTYEE